MKAGAPAELQYSPPNFQTVAGVGSLAAHVLIGAPDEGDYLLGDSIVSQ